ncbi:MAG: flagellar filament protein FlaA [Treponema sp.]|nr:flagellar filament protein FlaA [Treponema sp.]MDE7384025.1 flagellar filament outer layer protein FlaA [Treponemataceae bacterium]MBD5403708.1 flagellar filament protein FlaA [Treponema sp.]MBD5407420.1 flagellar filament protein FlaA [Treponema sp.]MBD5409723.1 flagellar filament protein FlaA [Treponema sp.]
MKKALISALALIIAFGAFAQNNSVADNQNAETVGNDSGLQALREVSLDKFEREGSWTVRMSSDFGVISSRLFEGNPSMKEPLEEDEGNEDTDTQVLGVKVEFFKRGVNSFYILSQRPIPVEGVTKTISLWVCGRNMDHDMYVLIEDYFGRSYELYMGSLGFTGWKKLTAVVPASPDGERGIVQHSAYYGERPGVRITGFRIDCNPVLARGSYYMYIDDLRCVTDLYDLEHRDEDDMSDNW